MSNLPSRRHERGDSIAPAVRRTFWAVPVGVAGLGGGIYLDTTGFWADHAFLGNLAVNVAGACIAIPAALWLLANLQGKQGEAAARIRIRRRAEAAAAEMTATVMKPFGTRTPGEVLVELDTIRGLNTELKSLWNFPAPDTAVRPGPIPEQRYSPLIGERNRRVESLFGIPVGYAPPQDDAWTAHIREQWDNIRQIRAAGIEAGLAWPSADTTVAITTAISRLSTGPQSAFVGYPVTGGTGEEVRI